MVDHPRAAGVHVAAAQVLGADDLAGGRLHQRRSAEEDRPLPADDHRLVGHRRHVGPARGARAEHGGQLRDTRARHRGLVVEDAAEVLAVREHLVLHRQERAPGVDEVDARQPVRTGDLLRTQVLLDRHGVVGAALDGRVVRHDHALPAPDPADPGDDAGAGYRAVVHAVRGQRAQLQERRARVQQPVDPVAHEQLAPAQVPAAGGLPTTEPGRREVLPQLGDQLAHRRGRTGRRRGGVRRCHCGPLPPEQRIHEVGDWPPTVTAVKMESVLAGEEKPWTSS